MPIVTGGGSGAAAALTSVDAALAAAVTIVNANAFTDGPSASFVAGTWLVWWQMLFGVTAVTVQSYEFTARLWDGVTTYSEAQVDSPSSINTTGFVFPVAGVAKITLGVTTTLKLSGASIRGASASQINADPSQNSSGVHVATRLTGLKLA